MDTSTKKQKRETNKQSNEFGSPCLNFYRHFEDIILDVAVVVAVAESRGVAEDDRGS